MITNRPRYAATRGHNIPGASPALVVVSAYGVLICFQMNHKEESLEHWPPSEIGSLMKPGAKKPPGARPPAPPRPAPPRPAPPRPAPPCPALPRAPPAPEWDWSGRWPVAGFVIAKAGYGTDRHCRQMPGISGMPDLGSGWVAVTRVTPVRFVRAVIISAAVCPDSGCEIYTK